MSTKDEQLLIRKMKFTKTVYGYIMAVRYHLDNEIAQKEIEESMDLSKSTIVSIGNISSHVSNYLNED